MSKGPPDHDPWTDAALFLLPCNPLCSNCCIQVCNKIFPFLQDFNSLREFYRTYFQHLASIVQSRIVQSIVLHALAKNMQPRWSDHRSVFVFFFFPPPPTLIRFMRTRFLFYDLCWLCIPLEFRYFWEKGGGLRFVIDEINLNILIELC